MTTENCGDFVSKSHLIRAIDFKQASFYHRNKNLSSRLPRPNAKLFRNRCLIPTRRIQTNKATSAVNPGPKTSAREGLEQKSGCKKELLTHSCTAAPEMASLLAERRFVASSRCSSSLPSQRSHVLCRSFRKITTKGCSIISSNTKSLASFTMCRFIPRLREKSARRSSGH